MLACQRARARARVRACVLNLLAQEYVLRARASARARVNVRPAARSSGVRAKAAALASVCVRNGGARQHWAEPVQPTPSLGPPPDVLKTMVLETMVCNDYNGKVLKYCYRDGHRYCCW